MSVPSLQGRRQSIIWVLWALMVCLTAALFISAIPLRYAQLLQAGQAGARTVHQLYPEEIPLLTEAGFTTHSYALWNVALEGLQALIYIGVGILIFARQRNKPIAWLVSLMLVTLGAGYPATTSVLSSRLALLVLGLGPALLLVYPYLFPNGRWVPAWSRWPALIFFIFAMSQAALGRRYFDWPTSLHIVLSILPIIPGFAVQVYRYHKVSGPSQKQQTKWVLYAMTLAFSGIALNGLARLLMNALGNPPWLHLSFNVFIAVPLLETLLPLLLPVAIAFSIFKYRLWDIDLVINRSLVYALMAGVLVLGFGLLAWSAQALLSAGLGLQNPGAALIISGLLMGLSARPIYARAQYLIDRRLYRLRFELDDLKQPAPQPVIENPGALSGQTLAGYHFLGLLGKGGMGEVYQGRVNDLPVAIKVIPNDLEGEPDIFSGRMFTEAQALAALDHPGIVHLYDIRQESGRVMLVMDYVAGESLRARLRRETLLAPEEVLRLLAPLASAIDYVHSQHIVHRDLKLSNIMLRQSDGLPVLMDFGLALVQQATQSITASGVVGTIEYMAPEQIMQSHMVDHRADLYALGVMTFEMLCGQRPFRGSTAQVLFGHLQQPPPPISGFVSHLPPSLDPVLQRMLSKTPEARYQSAQAFKDEIIMALQTVPQAFTL